MQGKPCRQELFKLRFKEHYKPSEKGWRSFQAGRTCPKACGGIEKRPLGLELVRGWTGTDENGEVNMRNRAERTLDAIAVCSLSF